MSLRTALSILLGNDLLTIPEGIKKKISSSEGEGKQITALVLRGLGHQRVKFDFMWEGG